MVTTEDGEGAVIFYILSTVCKLDLACETNKGF